MTPLLFRVDADARLGWGHLMRCLAIADAWRDAGGRACFVIKHDPANNRALLYVGARGYRYFPLAANRSASGDVDYLRAVAHGLDANWIVLDGYHFTEEYQRSVRSAGLGLAVLDDTGHLGGYHCDLLVNSSPLAGAIDYRCAPDTRKLLGPRFVPMRSEVARMPRCRSIATRGRRVLVTLGGGDSTELLLEVLQALRNVHVAGLEVQLVVGPANPHRSALQAELERAPDPRIELVSAVADLPARMAWADVAISAAGGTLWELAHLGVPSLALCLADNQRPIAAALAEQQAVVALGDAQQVTPATIAQHLTGLLSDAARRSTMAAAGRRAVDGQGAARIAAEIRRSQLQLRAAEDDDCAILWQWANDPGARAASFASAPIEWPTHRNWFAAQRADADCLLLIAHSAGGEAIGQMRFVRRQHQAVASISLEPAYRGLGLGTRLIRRATGRAFAQWRHLRRLEAEVKFANLASRRAFERAGFEIDRFVRRNGVEAVVFSYLRDENQC